MRNTTTSPAKSLKDLGRLLSIPDKRDRLLFTCGLHMGLRGTSELSRLRWRELLGQQISVFQPKTGKTRTMLVPQKVSEMAKECYEEQPLDSYVFTGRRGQAGDKPLSNRGLNLILKKYFDEYNIEFTGNCTSHALRKSFGRSFYVANGETAEALAYLQEVFQHSTIFVTLRYIGVQMDVMAQRVNMISYA